MKLVISPAKSLDFSTTLPTEKSTIPFFIEKAQQINADLKQLSPKDLTQLMGISEKLADLNWERNQNRNFQYKKVSKNARQAIYAFNGDVYTGLDAYSISQDKFKILNDKVRILSGLYGVLKPFDLIEPYRLEMGINLSVDGAKNLYEIWKPIVTEYLNSEMKKGEILVNLASKEYFSAIDTKLLNSKIITPEFKDYKDDKLKIISFYAKKARGLMARFIVENNINNVDDLKLFQAENYMFDEKLSSNDKLVFTR